MGVEEGRSQCQVRAHDWELWGRLQLTVMEVIVIVVDAVVVVAAAAVAVVGGCCYCC